MFYDEGTTAPYHQSWRRRRRSRLPWRSKAGNTPNMWLLNYNMGIEHFEPLKANPGVVPSAISEADLRRRGDNEFDTALNWEYTSEAAARQVRSAARQVPPARGCATAIHGAPRPANSRRGQCPWHAEARAVKTQP